MDTGKMVVEIEKNGDDRKLALSIDGLTIEDVCFADGAVLNDLISKNTTDRLGQLYMKLQAVHDICLTLDLMPLAKSIEKAMNQVTGKTRVKENDEIGW